MPEIMIQPRIPVGNAIATTIAQRVGETRDSSLLERYREQICQALGVSSKLFTHWLNNTSQPSVRELAVVAQVLEVPMENLLNY